ncbi:hypothetical protein SAMN05444320_104314 [Streptoalloteichus hindustanus]|uniref:Uncharacterized protein n=1 Tax=Streptoalloteichus hindustanus TaxID=2017 RepID=A0A1M5D618_STRHI|nr:hypothetical protein SAMN05444320_104314 [Streptoalloteichus hindustanus]
MRSARRTQAPFDPERDRPRREPPPFTRVPVAEGVDEHSRAPVGRGCPVAGR